MVLQYGVIGKQTNLCFMNTDKKIKLSKDESLFIRGPLSRFKELSFAFKVFFYFIKAFRKMHFIGPCVTVFGSARFTKNSDHYISAEKIGGNIHVFHPQFIVYKGAIRFGKRSFSITNGFYFSSEKLNTGHISVYYFIIECRTFVFYYYG